MQPYKPAEPELMSASGIAIVFMLLASIFGMGFFLGIVAQGHFYILQHHKQELRLK